MKCPFCHELPNKVMDSRLSKDNEVIRRRRECEGCGRRFTTYERVEEMLPLVIKKDGRREPFDRQKIVGGLQKACQKRPVSVETIERVVSELERDLQESGEKEVPASFVGERIMSALERIDEVAYVRFASVYRSFKDLNEFMSELKELLASRPPGSVSAAAPAAALLKGVARGVAGQGTAEPALPAVRGRDEDRRG